MDIVLFIVGIILFLSTIREIVLIKNRMSRTDRIVKQLNREAYDQWYH
jgi:hypothetical protein